MNVADHASRGDLAKNLLALFRGEAIHAYVDDRGAGADEFPGNEGGLADGGLQDIGTPALGDQVGGLGMADGDGGVAMEQEQGHGLADNVAAAYHYGMLAFDRNFVAVQQLDDPGRSAGSGAGQVGHQFPDVHGMKCVHVLVGADGDKDSL